MTSQIVPFVFEHDQDETPIRALSLDGKPWFVGADVCRALALEASRDPLRRLKPHEKGTYRIGTPGGPQQMVIINREGLTRLVMRSDKPQAEAFQDWIVEEVIPSICDTGKYEITSIGNRSIDGPDLLTAMNAGFAAVNSRFDALEEMLQNPRKNFSADSERYACEGVAKYENCECIYCHDADVVTKYGKLLDGIAQLHHGDGNARNNRADNCTVPCNECHKRITYTNRPDHIPHWKAISIATGFHNKLSQKLRQIKPPNIKTNPWDFRFATQGNLATLASWPHATKKQQP